MDHFLKLTSFLFAATLIYAQTEPPLPPTSEPPSVEPKGFLDGHDEIIKAKVASNAVSLIWEPSEEADQYMVSKMQIIFWVLFYINCLFIFSNNPF